MANDNKKGRIGGRLSTSKKTDDGSESNEYINPFVVGKTYNVVNGEDDYVGVYAGEEDGQHYFDPVDENHLGRFYHRSYMRDNGAIDVYEYGDLPNEQQTTPQVHVQQAPYNAPNNYNRPKGGNPDQMPSNANVKQQIVSPVQQHVNVFDNMGNIVSVPVTDGGASTQRNGQQSIVQQTQQPQTLNAVNISDNNYVGARGGSRAPDSMPIRATESRGSRVQEVVPVLNAFAKQPINDKKEDQITPPLAANTNVVKVQQDGNDVVGGVPVVPAYNATDKMVAPKINTGIKPTFEEFRNALFDEKKAAKDSDRRAKIMAIGDALRNIGNLYFTANDATPQTIDSTTAQKERDKYAQDKKERDAMARSMWNRQQDMDIQREKNYVDALLKDARAKQYDANAELSKKKTEELNSENHKARETANTEYAVNKSRKMEADAKTAEAKNDIYTEYGRKQAEATLNKTNYRPQSASSIGRKYKEDEAQAKAEKAKADAKTAQQRQKRDEQFGDDEKSSKIENVKARTAATKAKTANENPYNVGTQGGTNKTKRASAKKQSASKTTNNTKRNGSSSRSADQL